MSQASSIAARQYSPLYFLAAVGAGGLVVTFFMWLLFWVPHPGQPVPVFEDILAALQSGAPLSQAVIVGAMAGVAIFAAIMFWLLAWNISAYRSWIGSAAAGALRSGNNETQLLAAPLAVAMAINVGFILGLVFVPQLWSIVEYMFPAALVGFALVGVWALALIGRFWGRVFNEGGFDCAQNNSFAQMLPAFALAMVGVGLAAPAAMSGTPWVVGVAFIASRFFIVAAVVLGALKLVMGLRSMMENGASVQSAPTLWIVVPMLTVVGIALMRQHHGLHGAFGAGGGAAETFELLTTFLGLQIAFLLFGWVVLKRQNYFQRFVNGDESSPGSYALVCPGVALSVMVHFFVNKGLVAVGLIEKFGVAYWSVTAIAIVLQVATIALVFRLNAKHFGRSQAPAPSKQKAAA